MIISLLCIKRPVFAIVMNLIVLVVGIIAFDKLTIRGIPDIDPLLISITTSYPGASAEYMANNVTNIIEQSMRSIKLVDYISSRSSVGSSRINIFFALKADLNQALNDVRSEISKISFSFPPNMQTPQATKQDLDSSPSIFMTVSSNNHNTEQLTDIVEKQILIQLQRAPSVGTYIVRGGKYKTIKIDLDPLKLYKFNLNPTSIAKIINAQNTDYSAGIIKTNKLNFTLNLDARIKAPEDFKDIVITKVANKIIKLSDIANVSFAPTEETSIFKFNGQEVVAIGLIRQSKANVLDLSKEIKKILPELIKTLPEGIDISIKYDASLPIADSINEVIKTVIYSVLLVFLVVYLFLGSAQITLIPFVTIPISLVGTFMFMQIAGFSINTFSLLAMVLAIGLVVDDAIVVLENTYRYCSKGLTSLDASIKSINEIGFAVVVMTTTLASVFLPIGFLEGFVGKLFIEFAWTLAFCVIISGFVAITLSPVMCSKLIVMNKVLPKHLLKFQKFIEYSEHVYCVCLKNILQNQKRFALFCVGSILILILCFMQVHKTFVPTEDDGVLLMFSNMPQGTSLGISNKQVDLIGQAINKIPEVENFISVANSSGGFGYIILKDWSTRSKSQSQIKNEINKSLFNIPEVSAFISNVPSAFSGPSQKGVEFNLQGLNVSLEELENTARNFILELNKNPVFLNLDMDYKSSIPGIDIIVDKDKASLYDTSIISIGNTLDYLIATKNLNKFLMNDLIYNVQVGFGIGDRSNLSDLNKVYIKNEKGNMLPLSTFAEVNEVAKVLSYNRYNNLKAISISADVTDGIGFKKVENIINQVAVKIIDKNKIKMEFLGNLKRMSEQFRSLLFVFGISILFIYLVLAAQFESFTDPLIILVSVPFSITGAILALIACNNSINLYSNIGVITLIGLVTKNAIMIIEFANQIKQEGQNVYNSITKAAQVRFRPIMMTSLTTALGSLPLITATGGGAGARVSIGLVIFGGMILGTLFTLFVIPFVYLRFNKT